MSRLPAAFGGSEAALAYDGIDRVGVDGTETTLRSPDGTNTIVVSDAGTFCNGLAIKSGTVIASVSWDADTTTAGEATGSYRTNHLKAFRLAPGIWSIENMGTHPLIPGDSANWVLNSLDGGVGNPFFIADMTIHAFGQPSVGHPASLFISAQSLAASPNTGNLGSMIVKIKDKDGVVGDPTLAASYAAIKLTYIA